MHLAFVVFAFCASCAPAPAPRTPPTAGARSAESIGSATMAADGTIRLQLRAESDDGAVGDALLTYAPTDPKYQDILAHLGGLSPGQSKAVPPWPTVLVIEKAGTRLGTITIVRGKMGTLALTATGADATELQTLWRDATAKGQVAVEMHLPSKDGGRGPLGSRVFKPADKDFAKWVEAWLRYEHDYEVTVQ